MLKTIQNWLKPKQTLQPDTNNIIIKIIGDPNDPKQNRQDILGITKERGEELFNICQKEFESRKYKDLLTLTSEVSKHCKHVNEVCFTVAYIESRNRTMSDPTSLLAAIIGAKG